MMRGTRRFWLAVLVLFGVSGLATAEVKTSDITFKSGDDNVQGFLAEPEGKGPFPGIIVIQEWWGLNDWIKENAKRLAAQGYVALAPDLYRGKVATKPEEARQLVKSLPRDRALRDLKAAVDDLAGRANVDKNHLGSIGWCMGGGYSLQTAMQDARLKACVICYGRVVTEAEKLKPLQAAILGIFGDEDKGIPLDQVKKFAEALKKAGKDADHIQIFKAGHGFMREGKGPKDMNPAYREAETKVAWQDIDQFFAKILKGK